MPHWTFTVRQKQIRDLRGGIDAQTSAAAERAITAALATGAPEEEPSIDSFQILNSESTLYQFRIRPDQPEKAKATKHKPTAPKAQALYFLYTAWDAMSTQDHLRFLTEKLTPSERRALQVGMDDEENE